MGIVVVQSFGICVVVHGVFVAKTFVFYLLFFAVEVLIVSCLHRQNSVQCKFRMWAIFSHGVYCKNCKNFFTLLAVFRSRSFEHVVFAYVVFAQAKTLQDEFCRWASFLPTAFFCAVTTIRLFCNCLPSSWCLFRTVFFCKKQLHFVCKFVLIRF